jgi:carbon monoxide dehydrogenase subunit G
MKIAGTYTFNAPVEAVWNLLMDTSVVAQCLPGCKGLKPIGDDRYEAELAVVVAAISGNYKAVIALQDKQPPSSYRIVVEGSGRVGFVKGNAMITLSGEASSTTVNVAAEADVGGPVARVGQRLLEGVARMTMDKFYGCLRNQLAP